jgi:uncharacterized protein (TIGR03435 family)
MRKFVFAIPAILCSLWGNNQETNGATAPAFELVSVTHSSSDVIVMRGPGSVTIQSAPFRYSGEHVTCDLPLLAIIKEAFSVDEDYRIAGEEWLSTERYQIKAVAPAGTTKETARLMLQRMLRERFGLRYHREHREQAAYALVQAPGGAHLRAADPERIKEHPIDTPLGPLRSGSAQGSGFFAAAAMSLAQFCNVFLSHQMDGPVVDMTGLRDLYEIDLRWERDRDLGASNGPSRTDTELVRAIERQLRLKLERRKLPFDVLVIDHVEKMPTEN